MSGGYHYLDHSGPPQELIGPRHRLPIIAAPRPPITSHSTSSTNAQQPPWMNKHNTSSNYRENSGFYGHSAVSRDYASISRAHCNDESSAWSNPNFSNPLGNPPFGGILSNKNATSKNDVQKESMDLSASHGPVAIKTVSAASLHKMLAVNGDVAGQDLKNHLTPSSQTACQKDPEFSLVASASTTNATVDRKLNVATANDCPPRAEASLVSDNVEFALESLFNSDTSAIVPTLPSQNPKDMCVESVEKILVSPEGSDDDDLTILYDSHDSGNIPSDTSLVEKSPADRPASDKAAKVVILKKKNCDCNVKTGAKTSKVGDSTFATSIEPINCGRLNDVIENVQKNDCDARDADQISPELMLSPSANANTRLEPPKVIDDDSCKSANENPTSSVEPCNNVCNEEITFVQVENELEKMFAGIEDSSDPLATPKQPNLSATSIDAPNNLSLNSSSTHSTNLFDSVNVPAKASKKKTSKKSKPNASMKSMKDKLKSSSSLKESSSSLSSLDTMKRIPVIHIEGSKENPISAHIVNSIKSEEDDVSDGRTSAKRKLGKTDRAVKKDSLNFAFKKYDPATSDATWVCVFCNLCAHAPGMAGEATGDLFGPYFIRTPEQINLDESKIHSWRTTHLEQVKKKQKRSLSIERGYMDLSTSDEQKSLEVWAHENCIVWASGVHLIGSKLIGLEEAVMQALETICAHCSNKGASVGCRARHCNSCAHYSCAIYTGWKLDSDTFVSTCSVHSMIPYIILDYQT